MIRNAVIFHGTDGSSQSNWIPWLKSELEIIGYDVWAPDLPNSHAPNLSIYTKFVASQNFPFNSETILIGHSSGAVALLGLLPKLGVEVKASFLVSAFENDLGWPNLVGLFEKDFDFEMIRRNGGKMFFLHGEDDPIVPLAQADHLALQCAATLIPIKNGGHLNIDSNEAYREFPLLLGKIKQSVIE